MLVDLLTDKKQSELDPDALRKLKLSCKQGGDDTIKVAFGLLLSKLRTSDSKVFLSCLTLRDKAL